MGNRGQGEEAVGIKARRILAARLAERGVSKGIIADAFGVSYETIDADIIKAKELKVGNAVRTLEEAVKESPSPAAPYLADLLRITRRLPQGE